MCFLTSLEISNCQKWQNILKFTHLIDNFLGKPLSLHKSCLQLKFRKLYAANHKPLYPVFTAMWVDLNYNHNMVNHCFMNLIKVLCKKRKVSFQLERTFEIDNFYTYIEFSTAKIESIYTWQLKVSYKEGLFNWYSACRQNMC